jgi:integrase
MTQMTMTPRGARFLTALAIDKLRPRAVRYEVPDPGARGLRVVVQPSGRKSYAVRYRNAAGRARKHTLPAGITLAQARKLAADAMFEVAQGKDPAAAKQETRRSRGRTDDTIEHWARAFVERHAKRYTRPSTLQQTEHVLDDIVLPAWRGRAVHDIKRKHVRELLESVAETKPIMANRARAVLSKLFAWIAERDDDFVSPVIGVKPPAPERVRERVLDDDELRRLWLAADAIGGREGACVKLLMLTGQRRSEIARLRWGEVGDGVIELPPERMKGKQSHVVPLSIQAVAVIAAMPRSGDHIFGRTLVEHFHGVKCALDARMGDVPAWVIHDVRRSVASGMARIGVQLPVIEKILAHRKGSFAGVVGIYQRYGFMPEMAAAMQKWADHVDRLVGGKPAKVVRLRRR